MKQQTLHNIRLTERYDLSIPANAEGDVKAILQDACEKIEIWPFRIATGRKGTAVSIMRHPDRPQYKFIDEIQKMVTYLKMEFAVTTIIMVRTPVQVDMMRYPKEIHEIANQTKDYNEAENNMLQCLEEDMQSFDSHASTQTLDSDYDTREVKAANTHAIRRRRFERRCPIIVEAAPVVYSNGRQKTCEGQMVLDINKLMGASMKRG